MSGLFYDISTEAKAAWQTIADYFPLVRGEYTKITDINKEGNKNTFNNFCICSESIPDALKAIVAKNISVKTLATISSIVSNSASVDPEEAVNWFEHRLSNNNINSKVQDYMDTVAGSTMYESANVLGVRQETLHEVSRTNAHYTFARLGAVKSVSDIEKLRTTASDQQLDDIIRSLEITSRDRNIVTNSRDRIVANAALDRARAIRDERQAVQDQQQRSADEEAGYQLTRKRRREDEEAGYQLTRKRRKEEEQSSKEDEEAGYQLNRKRRKEEEQSSVAMSDRRSNIAFDKKYNTARIRGATSVVDYGKDSFTLTSRIDMIIPIINKKTGYKAELNLAANVRCMLVDVEQNNLLPVIGNIKERDNFYNYLKWRAGGASFAKDFLLNLKEIDKDVRRNTSLNLRDRIINDMIKTAGVTTPKFWGNLAETRYFTLILDKSDVSVLKEKYNFDVESMQGLMKVFNNLRLLSLVIVNQDRSELTFYDSDNPRNLNVINYNKAVSQDDLLKRLIMSRQ